MVTLWFWGSSRYPLGAKKPARWSKLICSRGAFRNCATNYPHIVAPTDPLTAASTASQIVVCLEGVSRAVGIEMTLQLQREMRYRSAGVSDGLLGYERRYWSASLKQLREGHLDSLGASGVSPPSDSLLSEYARLELPDPRQVWKEALPDLGTPWFRFLLSFDPAISLSRVRCPLLLLFAERDWQVAAVENGQAARRALEARPAADLTIETLPGLNHRFQTAKTGSPDEYGSLHEPISPDALRHVTDWLADLSSDR